jgi:hypothetical protein
MHHLRRRHLHTFCQGDYSSTEGPGYYVVYLTILYLTILYLTILYLTILGYPHTILQKQHHLRYLSDLTNVPIIMAAVRFSQEFYWCTVPASDSVNQGVAFPCDASTSS